jgi:hypothetical protein
MEKAKNSEAFNKAIEAMIARGSVERNGVLVKNQIGRAAEFVRDFDLEKDTLLKSKYKELSNYIKQGYPLPKMDRFAIYNDASSVGYAKEFVYNFHAPDTLKFIPKWLEKAKKQLEKEKDILTPLAIGFAESVIKDADSFLPIVIKFEKMKNNISAKKVLTEKEKEAKKVQERWEAIYNTMPSVNAKVITKMVEEVRESFKPMKEIVFEKEVARYSEMILGFKAGDEETEKRLKTVMPFYESVLDCKREYRNGEPVIRVVANRQMTSYPYAEYWIINMSPKEGWKSALEEWVRAYVESLEHSFLFAVADNFVKVTLPIKKITQKHLEVGVKGFEGAYLFEFSNGGSFIFKTEAIGAGGYNIQKYHFRYLSNFTDVKMPSGEKGTWYELMKTESFANGGNILNFEYSIGGL